MHRLPLNLCALLAIVTCLSPACRKEPPAPAGDEFLRWSNVGKAHLERDEAQPALAAFQKALALNPDHPDAKLNLANARLLSGDDEGARALTLEVLQQDRASAAAHYVAGVASLRLRDYTNAVQLLQQAKDIDIRENAVSMQLGLAYEGMGRFEEALAQYEEIAQFDPEHPGVHYRLSQTYQRLGRGAEAAAQLQAHQQWLAKNPGANLSPAALARCKFTQARIPFQLEQPDRGGITVRFTDVTDGAFGGAKFSGPAGVIDFARDGTNHLLVRDGNAFRVLINRGGRFSTNEQSFPATNGGRYTRWLVADLNKDGVPDALVLGDRGVRLLRFATNGAATDTTAFAGLRDFAAVDGAFADLNFRGDLDLVAIDPNGALRIMSNLQNMYFVDTTTNAPPFTNVRQVAMEDWNDDEMQDLFVAAPGGLALLLKQRGGAWSNAVTGNAGFGPATAFAPNDMNNDLRPDLVVAAGDSIAVVFAGGTNRAGIPLGGFQPRELKLIDHDNDGWLDILAVADGLRLFRNLGTNGFTDVTAAVGLDRVSGRIESVVFADLEGDCDSDLIVGVADAGLRVLRNDGGNANHQLRIALQGTRSNSSGLGVRIDVIAGGLRVARRVHELPVEIGVGKHRQLDAVNAHWFELSPSYTEINLTNCEPLRIIELALPTGSCPYLYSDSDGRTRFVADLLCSAPLGLPIAPGKFIDADEDEIVRIGNEESLRPTVAPSGDSKAGAGRYVLRITEELREVLYLDEATLMVVDHSPGTEVHSTTKMVPGRSSPGFGRHEIVTLKNRRPLLRASNGAGQDVTGLLMEIDERFASPVKLREPQLRGLAEPHTVTLDFGELEQGRAWVLALSGWLRFGGGMANIAASSYPDLPFPFPTLEAEVNGHWQKVDVELGAPSGRAKTIVADLADKLPPGARKLRITTAFEIHWDRMALFERAGEQATTVTRVAALRADLRRRGFSTMKPLREVRVALEPASPSILVPDYQDVQPAPLWRVTPSGWATRYGDVRELVTARDNALALICAGDELTLEFPAETLVAKRPESRRAFFLFVSGWDKDSDFHVRTGTSIEPFPWHGMDDQSYGLQPRPAFANDAWIEKYNTRWIGPRVLARRP